MTQRKHNSPDARPETTPYNLAFAIAGSLTHLPLRAQPSLARVRWMEGPSPSCTDEELMAHRLREQRRWFWMMGGDDAASQ